MTGALATWSVGWKGCGGGAAAVAEPSWGLILGCPVGLGEDVCPMNCTQSIIIPAIWCGGLELGPLAEGSSFKKGKHSTSISKST